MSAEQWMVVMPQSKPAMPTMAVRPLCFCGAESEMGSCAEGRRAMRRTPDIMWKTSRVAHSRTSFHAG